MIQNFLTFYYAALWSRSRNRLWSISCSRTISIVLWVSLISTGSFCQRIYHAHSILSAGNWYKIAVKDPGIYKVTVPMLNSMGFNSGNISSESIRLYGNGGRMLPEDCASPVIDDLQEVAIEVVDGGDGIINGQDYFLFYATGAASWVKDSVNKRFLHRKNLYSEESYYYISVSGKGNRVKPVNRQSAFSQTVNSFDERYFHELDSINFLSSGKEWFGEDFSAAPGQSLSRSFIIPLTNMIAGEPGSVRSECIARSIGSGSIFSINVNTVSTGRHDIPAVTAANTDLFANTSGTITPFTSGSSLALSFVYSSTSPGAQGWLNWFEIFVRCRLAITASGQLAFRDWNSVRPGTSSQFILQGASAETNVWDITNPAAPLKMASTTIGSDLQFVNETGSLHEYIAFGNNGLLSPVTVGAVGNQDLHALSSPGMILVTDAKFSSQATRLAAFHQQHDNLTTTVVTSDQVYNEFSSGSPDPSAIRNFVKMFYDKAGQDTAKSPKYLLLFGDASYDYKSRVQNSLNFVPAYLSSNSLDPLATYTSDDFFGFLEDGEDIGSGNANSLDIGIGRVPVSNTAEATAFVDKLIAYKQPSSFGPWRNHISFIADDEDFNLHFHDAEVIAATAAATNPNFISKKIYLDAYQQQSNSSGSRYPAVNQAINEDIGNGTLIWNYSGHGGVSRLAEEVVLDKNILNSWSNAGKLPLFVTATCDFAPYDNPAAKSLGEEILLRQQTGAIALMTTTRLVFAYSNRILNRNYLQTALQQKNDGGFLSLGEAVRAAKNLTFQTGGDLINNLKFTLLGDPALTLNFPANRVQTNTINGKAVSMGVDTLNALQHYNVEGSVVDNAGNLLNGFSGNIYITVYDKPRRLSTRGNDPGSIPEFFEVQENILFRGRADVKSGNFQYGFTLPVDIDYQAGNGRISYYAENGSTDANGSFNNLPIGGSQGLSSDKTGPLILAFLDDENFVTGKTTGPTPLLIVKLKDSSGLNISGNAIGHDLVAIVDGKIEYSFVLNQYFEADQNSYQQGSVRFRLPELTEGPHTMLIKAWDAANNSSQQTLEFVVMKGPLLKGLQVFNFPNPSHSKTTFRVQHESQNQNLQVLIRIFTVSGALIKSIQQTINTGASRSSDIEWDGRPDNGTTIRTGIYFFNVTIRSADGTSAHAGGKIIRY